jgi:hypothetical protein
MLEQKQANKLHPPVKGALKIIKMGLCPLF